MALADLSVQDYNYRQGVHKWLVTDASVDKPNNPAAAVPYSEVRFYNRDIYDSGWDDFLCSCYSLGPYKPSLVCDHIITVARFITTKAGSWESDRRMMEIAWGVSTRPGPLKVECLTAYSTAVRNEVHFCVTNEGTATRFIVISDGQRLNYSCSCGTNYAGAPPDVRKRILCDHIQAVREFEWKEIPTAKPIKIDEWKKTDDWKITTDADIQAAARAMNEVVEQMKAFQQEIEKQDLTKIDNAEIDDQRPEHKEPEEPRKPKSRFSEIDL